MDAKPKPPLYADALAAVERRIVDVLPEIVEGLIARAKAGGLVPLAGPQGRAGATLADRRPFARSPDGPVVNRSPEFASRHEPRTSLSRFRKANVPAGSTGPVLQSFTGTCRTGQRATAQGRSCRATCQTAFAPSLSNDYVGIVIVIVDALEGGA